MSSKIIKLDDYRYPWWKAYIESKGNDDTEITWSRFSGKLTVGDVREALERAERYRKEDRDQAEFPYMNVCWVSGAKCPNCKHFHLRHAYGDHTCTGQGVLTSVLIPSSTCCHNHEFVDDIEKAEILWITFRAWHMLYENCLPNALPFTECNKLYWAWRNSPEGKKYEREYFKRKHT